MATTKRVGFTDAYHQSRLQHITGTGYPSVPTGTYLALYAGTMPVSDGTGGTEATGTRPTVTLGAPATDANSRYYITNTAPVSVTLATTSASQIVGFGIQAAATGGTPIYMDRLPDAFQVAAGATITIPTGAIRVYAETNI